MSGLLTFLLRRAFWSLVTLWVVYTLTFVLMRMVPGGPFSSERELPAEIRKNIEDRYHLNDPFLTQYGTHLWQLVWRGDLGLSFKLEDFTVNEVIRQGFPVSASLGVFALTFGLILGTTAGVISAVRRHSPLDVGLMGAATLGVVVPNFVLASVAIVAFVFELRIFPAAGWGSLRQLILPAMCLGAPYAGYIARLTRTGMLEVLGQDYIRTAYAKGLGERRVVVRHALRGALLPVVSYLGPATAGILTGSLVLEQIFALPGMGSHFVEAALQRDYTMAMGVVLVYTVLLVFMNAMVDISYVMIDPRVKLESR